MSIYLHLLHIQFQGHIRFLWKRFSEVQKNKGKTGASASARMWPMWEAMLEATENSASANTPALLDTYCSSGEDSDDDHH
jgi:hypothetical protein